MSLKKRGRGTHSAEDHARADQFPACSLIDVPKLRAQLVALERRTGRTTDVIDHPRGQHDDLANAALGALVAGQLMRPLNEHDRLVRDYPEKNDPWVNRMAGKLTW